MTVSIIPYFNTQRTTNNYFKTDKKLYIYIFTFFEKQMNIKDYLKKLCNSVILEKNYMTRYI